MRRTYKHSELHITGVPVSACEGTIRRLYARDHGTRNGNNRRVKQSWKRTQYLFCEECGAIFEKEGQGMKGGKLVRDGE